MELNQLSTAIDHETGGEVNILSPVTGDETDVFIKVQGADSKVWRAHKRKQTMQMISARADGKEDDLDYEAMDIEALADVTLEWRGITVDGDEYECTQENARKLYENSPSIVAQLLVFISDRENFTKG